jgi:hypothetical protein
MPFASAVPARRFRNARVRDIQEIQSRVIVYHSRGSHDTWTAAHNLKPPGSAGGFSTANRHSWAQKVGKRTILCAIAVLLSACGGSPVSPTPVTTITAVSPSQGTTLGGTNVTISGTNFAAGATVTIGGAAATGVSVSGPTSITATTPQHAAGAVDVLVTLPDGQRASLSAAFTYVPPQPVVNTPPVISSIVVQGSVGPREPAQFASLDETVAVTATVSDAETPLSELTYQWSSDSGGAFSGAGSRVTWTAPHTVAGAPATVVLTLTVIEQYQTTDTSGLPITATNTVRGTTSVRVHDSIGEINDLAVDFLDGFSRQLDPAYVVRNFTDACSSKADEQSDVQKNNNQNIVTSYSIGTPDTTIVFIGPYGCPFRGVFGDACAQVPVDWHATNRSTHVSGEAKGTDQVTAVLENDRWRLCASDFNSTSTSTALSKFLVIR